MVKRKRIFVAAVAQKLTMEIVADTEMTLMHTDIDSVDQYIEDWLAELTRLIEEDDELHLVEDTWDHVRIRYKHVVLACIFEDYKLTLYFGEFSEEPTYRDDPQLEPRVMSSGGVVFGTWSGAIYTPLALAKRILKRLKSFCNS